MALEGTLGDFGLPDILQLISLQRKTGVLTLEAPDDAATVFLQDGAVVWARFRRHPMEERIRRLLPLRRLVTEAQMAEAERAQAETGQPLRNVLVQRRLIPKEAWDQAVALEVQEGLYRLLGWREGSYRFETRTSLDLDEGRTPPLTTEMLLLEGFRRRDEWPAIARRIPRLEGVLQVVRPREEIDPGALSERERRVLALVDGRMRAADVVDGSGLGEFEACKVLASLIEAGLVGLAPESGGEAAAAAPAPVAAARRFADAWTGWTGWTVLGVWLALILLAFRPWAPLFSPPSADLLKVVRARAGMAALAQSLDLYFAEVGGYPPELHALVRRGMV
ncbi:MAG TPA: DUF4388 domain-containing protein, partial [Candidatus Methylomirabilis sp.]